MRVLALVVACAAIVLAQAPINPGGGGNGGGGGSGTVTSITASCGLSGGTITTSGTISNSIAIDSQTGSGAYAIPSSDCGKSLQRNNTSAVSDTIAQAGTGSFTTGWYADYQCIGAGGCTITPTTSTINGAASLVLVQGQGVGIVSDGTNYRVQGSIAAGGGGSPAGATNAVQTNGGGGNFGDSGLTAASGNLGGSTISLGLTRTQANAIDTAGNLFVYNDPVASTHGLNLDVWQSDQTTPAIVTGSWGGTLTSPTASSNGNILGDWIFGYCTASPCTNGSGSLGSLVGIQGQVDSVSGGTGHLDFPIPIGTTANNVVPLTISGTSGQSADLLDFTGTVGGSILAQFAANGALTVPSCTGCGGVTIPSNTNILQGNGSGGFGTGYTTSGTGTVVCLKVSCTMTTPNIGAATGTSLLTTTLYTNTEYDNGTCTTSKTISLANGNRQKVTLTNADTCTLTFTQPSSSTASVQLKIIQSSAGSFNGLISGGKWPGGAVPTITATSAAVDIATCYLDGTNAYCVATQNFQ